MQPDEVLKLENQLCFPLYAAARQVVSAYTPYLKPLGLTYTQYIVFLVLWEKHAVPIRDLCRMLYLDTGTLTPVLKKLESEGYLTRSRSEEDERVVLIELTEKGTELKESCRSIPGNIGQCFKLSAEEAGALYTILHKLLSQTED